MSSPCQWRVAGLFCAQVYQYLHYKQVLPTPLAFIMIVKNLVEKPTSLREIDLNRSRVECDDTIYHAYERFVKTRADYLLVYENGEFQGILKPISIAQILMMDFHIEREKRLRLVKLTNYFLIKLKSLIDKLSYNRKASVHSAIIQQTKDIVDNALDSIKE